MPPNAQEALSALIWALPHEQDMSITMTGQVYRCDGQIQFINMPDPSQSRYVAGIMIWIGSGFLTIWDIPPHWYFL